MSNNKITNYFLSENTVLNGEMIQRSNVVQQLIHHCNAVKKALPQKDVRTLKHFNSFYDEIIELSQKYQQRISRVFSSSVLKVNALPSMIAGLKMGDLTICIDYLTQIDRFLEPMEYHDIKTVYDHKIVPHLLYFCKLDHPKLQRLALVILSRMCHCFHDKEANWESIWNPDSQSVQKGEQRDIFRPIINLLSTKGSSLQYAAMRFITKYGERTKGRRDLLFRHLNITEHILRLLSLQSDFKLIVSTLEMVQSLCKPTSCRGMPLKLYTNRIMKHLNMVLFIEDDEILDQLFDCYKSMTHRWRTRGFEWNTICRNTLKVDELKSAAKRRAKRDAKSFNKSIKTFERKQDFIIPMVIKGEIIQFAAVFDRKKAKNTKYNLDHRICSLYGADYESIIDTNKVLEFIDDVSFDYRYPTTDINPRKKTILNDMLCTTRRTERMKEMLSATEASESDDDVKAGVSARLQGLSMEEFNGKMVRIIRYVEKARRWKVKLLDVMENEIAGLRRAKRTLGVKKVNLETIPQDHQYPRYPLAYQLLWKIAMTPNGLKQLLDTEFYNMLVDPIKMLFLIGSRWKKDCQIFEMVSIVIGNDFVTADVLRRMIGDGLGVEYCDVWLRCVSTARWKLHHNRTVFPALRKMIAVNMKGNLMKSDLIQRVSYIASESSNNKYQTLLRQLHNL